MEKGFFERVNHRVNTTPTIIPLDVALLGLPLDEAVCIDINHAVGCIADSESKAENLSFGDLTDARPPVACPNLFVQFRTDAAQIKSEFPAWLGVHLVPFEVARASRLFGMMEEIPARIDNWSQAYALVIYREWPVEISLAPAGMLIGLNEEGTIIDAAMFGIMMDEDKGQEQVWEHVSKLTAWIVYLVFCVFTMVNQGETPIIRAGPGHWRV
jgi:hypothetical protein